MYLYANLMCLVAASSFANNNWFWKTPSLATMALPKATMLAALFFIVMLSVDQYVYASQDLAAAVGLSHGKSIDCNGLCSYRCSKSWKHKMCMRACNTCCQRCNCVPPGTVGNKEVCPCYANMKTHGGRYKCP